MGGAEKLKPQASSSLGARWLPWWLSLREANEEKGNKTGSKFRKMLMKTPKNPSGHKRTQHQPLQQALLLNLKQRMNQKSNGKPYQLKKIFRQGSICLTLPPGITQLPDPRNHSNSSFSQGLKNKASPVPSQGQQFQ